MTKGYTIIDDYGVIEVTTDIDVVLWASENGLCYFECDIEDKKEDDIFEGCLVVDDNYSDVIGVVHNGEIVE